MPKKKTVLSKEELLLKELQDIHIEYYKIKIEEEFDFSITKFAKYVCTFQDFIKTVDDTKDEVLEIRYTDYSYNPRKNFCKNILGYLDEMTGKVDKFKKKYVSSDDLNERILNFVDDFYIFRKDLKDFVLEKYSGKDLF